MCIPVNMQRSNDPGDPFKSRPGSPADQFVGPQSRVGGTGLLEGVSAGT